MAGPKRGILHLVLAGNALLAAGACTLIGLDVFFVVGNLWAAAFQVLAAYVTPQFGAVLSQSGMTLRGWSTRHYPWHEVQSIEPVNFLFARRAQVRLVTRSRKIRSWAPYDDFLLPDLKFDQRVEAMQQWHAETVRSDTAPAHMRP